MCRGGGCKRKLSCNGHSYRPVTVVLPRINHRMKCHALITHILSQRFLLRSSKVKYLVGGNLICEGGAGPVDHRSLSAWSACHGSHAPPNSLWIIRAAAADFEHLSTLDPPQPSREPPPDQLRWLLCLLECRTGWDFARGRLVNYSSLCEKDCRAG